MPILRSLYLCLACAIFLAVAAAFSDSRTASEAVDDGSPRLSQNQFYIMKPFTLPLLKKTGQVGEHFTIVVALELVDEEQRATIARLVPRIRDEMYRVLYHLVTFRRKGAPIPDIGIFKYHLMQAAKKTSGPLVKQLLVQQAFTRVAR